MSRNSFSEPFSSVFDMEPYFEQRKTNIYMDKLLNEYEKEKEARIKAEKSAQRWQWATIIVAIVIPLLQAAIPYLIECLSGS